jgi:tetratricopeptide (TPR) repeat protein
MEMSRVKSWGITLLTVAFLLVLVGSAPWMRPRPFEQTDDSWEALAVDAVRAIKAGMLDKAYELCDRAMEAAGDGKNGDTRLSRTYTLLGEIHTSADNPEKAVAAFNKAVALCEQSCGPTSDQLLEPLDALANFHFYRDELQEVAPIYERITHITELSRAQAERNSANRARNLAEVQRKLLKFPEAEQEFQKCLQTGEAAGQLFRSDLLQDMLLVADFYREWGNVESAEELADRGLAIAEQEMGVDSIDAALALECLAKIQLAAAKPQAAEEDCRRAVKITEQLSGTESSDLAPRLALLATALQAQQENSEAEQHLKRALTVTENDLGDESPEVATLLEQHAAILMSLGRKTDSGAAAARAAAIRNLISNPRHDEIADCVDCGAK